jgi:flagellin
MLDIINNQAASTAESALNTNESSMNTSLQQLSTGYKINKAADDAAGLVISDHLNEEISGYTQAASNAQNAVSVVQTADGALNEVTSILNTVYQLAEAAANQSVNDSTATTASSQEISQSLADIDQISQQTQFGSLSLLWTSAGATGSTISFTFQVGWSSAASSQLNLTITALSTAALGLGGQTVGTDLVGTVNQATALMSLVQAALNTVDTERGQLGGAQNAITNLAANLNVGVQNLQSAESGYKDTDMASAMVAYTSSQILVQAGVSMLSQANSNAQDVLKLLQ